MYLPCFLYLTRTFYFTHPPGEKGSPPLKPPTKTFPTRPPLQLPTGEAFDYPGPLCHLPYLPTYLTLLRTLVILILILILILQFFPP